MSAEWNTLPLLPLRSILGHLSVEDALAATSTCRHWRQGMLLYEGRKNLLKLNTKNLEENLFLTRVFRKNTNKLHVYINCSEDQFSNFLTYMLPQFFDTKKLEELVFIGPIYLQQSPLVPFSNLKRLITESLIFKHAQCIKILSFLGCEMNSVKEEKDRLVHKQVKYYSKPLSFPTVTSPANTILTRSNVGLMTLSTLKHIMFEYELISTEAVETLALLKNFNLLTLNVIFKQQMVLPSVNWRRVNASFRRGLDISVNVIGVPEKKIKTVMDKVFVEGMSLISLKVFYCKTLYLPLVSHVCCLYNGSLLELVWADAPYEGVESKRTLSGSEEDLSTEMYNHVNPLILLCWQCENLCRLVIHGYWIWQYDFLGFIRLRKSLKVEVSALFGKQDKFGSQSRDANVLRVMHNDSPPAIDNAYIQEVNKFTEQEWRPYSWRRLHPGLKRHSSAEQRADYILGEVLKPLGIT